MTTFVSFIRGINVGGKKLLKMEALKALYADLGLNQVRSHLQSGNVVFESGGERSAMAERIEDAIEKQSGFRPAVVLRTAADLKRIIAENPLKKEQKSDPSHLLVMFLAGKPREDAETRLAETYQGPETVCVAGEEAYLYYPAGIARSKLTNTLLEKQLGAVGTARNWNTVTKLLEIAEG